MNVNINDSLVVILVGGFGTRVKHLLNDIPKPLAIVHSKPFLYWIVKFYYDRGYRNVVLACHYNHNYFYDFVNEISFEGLLINIVLENSPLGTAGSFLNVYHKYNYYKNYIVHNGDTYFNYNQEIINNFYDNSYNLEIIAKEMNDCSRYGSLFIDKDSNLISFTEKKPGIGLINTGIYLISNKILSMFRYDFNVLSFEYDFFPMLLNNNFQIKVHISYDDFIDIGTEGSLKSSENFMGKVLLNDEM